MKDFELEESEDFKNLRIQDFKNEDFEEFDGLKTNPQEETDKALRK